MKTLKYLILTLIIGALISTAAFASNIIYTGKNQNYKTVNVIIYNQTATPVSGTIYSNGGANLFAQNYSLNPVQEKTIQIKLYRNDYAIFKKANPHNFAASIIAKNVTKNGAQVTISETSTGQLNVSHKIYYGSPSSYPATGIIKWYTLNYTQNPTFALVINQLNPQV